MNEYIFRFPADTPPLTYGELQGRTRIGTTVTIGHDPGSAVLWLYDTPLARIYPDRVEFTEHGDRHMATTEWLARIAADNGIAGGVYTEHFVRYIGGTPLEGHTFPVSEASTR